MNIYSKKSDVAQAVTAFKLKGFSIGIVPTMGALHEGHLQLVKRALQENDSVVVSIFVNPTQFDNKDDLDNYPRTLEHDLALLKTLNKTRIIVYAPSVKDIYPEHAISDVFDFDGLEFEMEGKFRIGHFNGVGTIIKRLLEIVKPHNAYFGEKDFQQLQIVTKLAKKYNIPVNIKGCKIHREASGLAMSSRNTRLKLEHKTAAPFIYETLKLAKIKFGTKSADKVTEWVYKQFKTHKLLELEYFLIADTHTLKPVKQKSNTKKYRAFIAVYAGDIRLIDNIALN